MWVECETSLILNCLLQVGQKVESSGLDFKKLDKQRKQKACWKDLMISAFLSRFSHMPQAKRWRWGFISVAKSFKVNFLGNKSGSVISFCRFSKVDCVWFYPEVFFVFSVFVSPLSLFEVISLYYKFGS